MILKSGRLRDDTGDVTSVIVIQSLVGALAGLLLLETRLRRDERARAGYGLDATAAPIKFHPELIIRWDDEANYARGTSCTRKLATERAESIRPQVTVSGSNTRIR